MTTQPEQVLETNLVNQLVGLGHKSVVIKTEDDLLRNLKVQLEKHNKTTFTDSEFDRILIHLTKGSIFDKAKTLRDKFVLIKDNGDKTYIEFLNQDFSVCLYGFFYSVSRFSDVLSHRDALSCC